MDLDAVMRLRTCFVVVTRSHGRMVESFVWDVRDALSHQMQAILFDGMPSTHNVCGLLMIREGVVDVISCL